VSAVTRTFRFGGRRRQGRASLPGRLRRFGDRIRLWLAREPQGCLEPDILRQLQEPDCPICNSVKRHDRQFLFWFFNEMYHNVQVLIRFGSGLGFCRWHAQRLMATEGSRSQLGFIHLFVVPRLRRALQDRVENNPYHAPAPCLACQSRDESMQRAAFFLSRVFRRTDHATLYGNPARLCFPHLRWILTSASGQVFEELLDRHMAWLESGWGALTAGGSRNQAARIEIRDALLLAVGEDQQLASLPDFVDAANRSSTAIPQDPVLRLTADLSNNQNCAVCRELARAWVEWMGAVDDAARAGSPVADLVPICNEHAWSAFRDGSDALAFVVAKQSLTVALSPLQNAIAHLRHPAASRRKRFGLALDRARDTSAERLRTARSVLAFQECCPVCTRLHEAEDRTLQLLFSLLAKAHHRTAFERGYGLCLKHVSRAMQLRPDAAVREFLTRMALADLSLLEWELEEHSRKAAWSARAERRAAEAEAPLKALQRFSGLMRVRGPCLYANEARVARSNAASNIQRICTPC
jgi:hypothetical protein